LNAIRTVRMINKNNTVFDFFTRVSAIPEDFLSLKSKEKRLI